MMFTFAEQKRSSPMSDFIYSEAEESEEEEEEYEESEKQKLKKLKSTVTDSSEEEDEDGKFFIISQRNVKTHAYGVSESKIT